METRWGPQPLRKILDHHRWTLRRAADEIGVPYAHMRAAGCGAVVPCPEVRERLPKLTGIPIEELFNPEVLEQRYKNGAGKRGHRQVKP